MISFSDGRRITNSYDDAGTLVSRTLRTGGRLPRTTTERYAGPHVGSMAANAVPAVSRSYFEGGYFDAEGKVHYFVTDYQGNVLEDRKARGTVVASAQYYPYGEPWTEPTGGNDRWFGGKERLAAEGLPMSDFGPRLLNHAYPSWHTQDIYLEGNVAFSPYVYCNGNPVNKIDPSGMVVIDVDNILSNYKNNLEKWIMNLKTSLSSADFRSWENRSLLNFYTKQLSKIRTLDKSETTYIYQYGETTGLSVDPDSGNIFVNFVYGEDTDELVAHETNHANQYEKGEISIRSDSEWPHLYDITDEVESYNIGRTIMFGIEASKTPKKEYEGYPIIMNANDVRRLGNGIYDKLGNKSLKLNKETKAIIDLINKRAGKTVEFYKGLKP